MTWTGEIGKYECAHQILWQSIKQMLRCFHLDPHGANIAVRSLCIISYNTGTNKVLSGIVSGIIAYFKHELTGSLQEGRCLWACGWLLLADVLTCNSSKNTDAPFNGSNGSVLFICGSMAECWHAQHQDFGTGTPAWRNQLMTHA